MPLRTLGGDAFLRAQVWWRLLLGRRAAAIAVLQDAVRQRPGHPYALGTLAHVLAEAGDVAGAACVQQQLVQLQPGDAVAWFNLGYLHERLSRFEAAEAAFETATRQDPGLDRAWYGLGLCRLAQSRLEAAEPALRKAAELQPMSPFAWYQLARLHAERGERGQAADIIAHLSRFEPRVADQLVRETGLAPTSGAA